MRSNPINSIRNRRRSEEGFTLIELLVVVVILGILIGIAIPVYLNYRKSANDKAAQSDVRNAISTMEVCNSDGGYPTSITQGTTAATATTITLAGCTTQSPISVSSGTLFSYTAPTGTAGYLLFGGNSGGSKVYCYDSAKGGSVKESSTASFNATKTTLTGTTACP